MDAQAWWLFGSAAATRLDEQEAAAPGTLVLPDGGYTVFRGAGRRVIFDHGPLGLGSLAAHGHADALGVQVSFGPNEVVTDPGVGSYFARPDVRRAFRGTGFHATVEVDGVDSSEQSGPFLWTEHAGCRVLRADLASGIVVAEHTGFERLTDPVVHRRLVCAPPDSPYVLVVDRLDAQDSHRYSQRWPLHPELEPGESRPGRIVAVGASCGVVIVPAAMPGAIEIVSYRGVETPPAGWWSSRLESYEPSWLFGVDVEATGSVELATVVVPFAGDLAPDVELELGAAGSITRLTLAVAGSIRELELDLGGESLVVSRAPVGVA
jgi:Heparinase II/III-like protein